MHEYFLFSLRFLSFNCSVWPGRIHYDEIELAHRIFKKGGIKRNYWAEKYVLVSLEQAEHRPTKTKSSVEEPSNPPKCNDPWGLSTSLHFGGLQKLKPDTFRFEQFQF